MSSQSSPEAVVTVVELPCGYIDDDNKVTTQVSIIPMTGRVRKLIAKPEIRQNPAKVVDTLLMQCVVAIGDITRVRKNVTDCLFMADRDFLVMEIRKLSLGNDVNAQLKCECGAKMAVTVNLATEVPIKKLKDEDIVIEDGMAVFALRDKQLGVDAKFRLPTGHDQHAVAHMYRKNPIAANYALYQSCLVSWNGVPSNEINPEFFDNLSLPELDYVDENFMEIMPGPDMRVPLDCVECGAEIIMAMESSDFLFRTPKKGRT